MNGVTGKNGFKNGLKAAIIIVLLLLLLIPLGLIKSLVYERQGRARETQNEIIAGAGGSLEMVGPLLVLPFVEDVVEYRDGERVVVKRRGSLCVLPEDVLVSGDLDVEYRYRGIYRVPVYAAHLRAKGFFTIPGRDAYPDGALPLAGENRLVVGIADMRGIREVSELRWGESGIEFHPNAGDDSGVGAGIGASVGALSAAGERVDFDWNMEIGGGGSVSVAPLARNAELFLEGDWPSPSFGGSVLPDEREWDESGFQARWRIPEVSRPIRSRWVTSGGNDTGLEAYALSVELLEPVSAYARAERSVKYGALFLLIPFVVFFLFETLGRIRIHPVQYLLAGAADVVFYLLLLAVSEQMAFDAAYLLAAAGVTVLISLYSGSVTRRWVSALVMTGVLAAAYVWLWITLKSEDYALLIGSIGLFVMLGLVMFLTRKTDWYGGGKVLSGDSAGTSGKMAGLAGGADFSTEGDEGQAGELDVLPGEGNPDDGDEEDKGDDKMPKGQLPAEE